MIAVFLVEDQAMVRGALAALLSLEDDIEIVGQAPDGRRALAEITDCEPDLVLTDIEMPHMTGLELAQQLQQRNPSRPRVIILTTFARAGYLQRALDAGAAGYVLKDTPASRLADVVRRVARGLRVIDPELALDALADRDPLTERERQILRLVHTGRDSGQIANELHLSSGTVRNYLSEAMHKLGASNRVEAARLARDRGWL